MGSLSFEIKALTKNLNYQQDNELDAVVKITAPEMDVADRKSLEIVACVDVSGSMGGNKIAMVQRSLKKLVENLTDKDRLGIVTFTGHVERLAELSLMTSDNKIKFEKLISSMRALDSTNFSGGMVEAINMMKHADCGGAGLRRIIMFTDGQANMGVSDTPGILRLAKNMQLDGVALTCFGYGSDHDAEMMQSLASQSGGNFYYAEDPDKILSAFGSELGGLISTAAQSLSITLSPQSGVSIRQIYNDLTVTPVKNGTVKVEVGDVLAGSTVYVALGLDVDKRDKKFPRPVLVLKGVAEYVDMDDLESHVMTGIDLKIKFVKLSDVDATVDKEVEEHVLLQKSVRAELEAKNLAQSGDYQAAQMCMLNFASVARGAGYNCLADDMNENAPMYATPQIFTSTAGLRGARSVSKSSYKASGVEVRCMAASVGTQSQQDMADNFGAQPSPLPNLAAQSTPGVIVTPDVDEDDEKKAKKSSPSVSVTGQRRSSSW